VTTSDKIRLFIFLGCVAGVYAAELFMVSAFILGKLGIASGGNILLAKKALLVHVPAVLGIACLLYGYFIEPYRLEINTIEVRTHKLAKTTFHLVHISDIHCDRKLRNEPKVVEIINSLEPDVIVFTGDSINSPDGLEHFKDTMKKLKAALSKLAVYGNFEVAYWDKLGVFDGTGFKVLDGENATVEKDGEKIYITGISCAHPERAAEALKQVPPANFSVFLYHYPDLVEDLSALNVDLYLCGHTHGGQVALPIYGAIITMSRFGKKYESGLYHAGDTKLYVNRGIGLDGGIAPRVRFFARPEITVFEITPAEKSPSRTGRK